MLKWTRRILEFIAVFITVIALVAGVVAWRVASHPITSTTLTPYIVTALESLFPKSRAEIAATLIVWDNVDHSIAIQADKVNLRDSKGGILAEFPSVKMRLSVISLLQGRFFPSDLAIPNPQIWLVRHADGTVWFGAMGTGGKETPSTEEELSVWDATRHFTREMTRIGGLQEMAITNATLSVHDEEATQDWAIHIPEITLHHGWRGLKGLAKIEVNQGDHATLLEAHYKFDRSNDQHNITLQFQNINPSVLTALNPDVAKLALIDLPLSGELELTTDQDLYVVALGGKINGGEGALKVPDLWDKPRAIKSLKVEGKYDRLTGRLNIPEAEIDFGGPKLSLKAEGQKPSVETKPPADLAFTATIRLTDLPLDQYGSVWPKPVITNPAAWIAEHLSKGQFTQGEVNLKGSLAWNDLANMTLASGEGRIDVEGATVAYLDGMPPVENVNAEATLDLKHMDVRLTSGNIGALKVVPFTIKMTDFEQYIQNIVLPVKIAGPVRDVIKLIDAPRLGYAKQVGLNAENCEGNVEGTLELSFPLLKDLLMKDVAIKAEAQLANFGLHKTVPGIEITQGNLALTLDKDGYALKGPATLNKVPLQLSWTNRFSKENASPERPLSRAVVTGVIYGEQWQQFGLDMTGKFKGPSLLKFQYDQIDPSMAHMAGEVDFKQTTVQLDELSWKKPAGVSAVLKFEAEAPTDQDIQIKTIDLQGSGVKVKGTATLERGSQRLLSADLQPIVMGRTDATLHFAQAKGENGDLRFEVNGESFDVSGLTGGKDPARTDPRVKSYSLKLNKLYTSEDGFIADLRAKARRDPKGWSEIDLHGLADGGHQLDLVLAVSPSGKRTFSLTCDDFGKALKGMGFTNTVRDGALEIKGESVPDDPRVIEGTAKIGHFVVAGLPVLARLINAASPFGFIDLVTGNASFDHLEGNFRWQGDGVDLIKMRAAGSVFGLNIDGHVDLNTGESNVHGTMVPFSLFNRLINAIPLLGDVITGGEGGGVLAVSYSVTGKLADADISVNPVSLLTPGFLRNLFFDEGTGDSGSGTREQNSQQGNPESQTPSP